MPHRPSAIPEWEAQTSKNLFDAKGRPPPQVPWTPEEDAILIRLMVSWCDIQEYQVKIWGYLKHECKERGIPIPAERDLLDVIRRVQVLQDDHLKYKITLQNRRTLYRGTDAGPLWEDKSELSSSSRAAEAASHSKKAKEQQQHEEEEEDSEGDEDEVVEVVKVKKKKQAKVVEVEESEDEEEEAEEEANTRHTQAEHRDEADGASQQQNPHLNAAAAANSQDNSPRSTKRQPTLLLEAGGKRMRIGIPPKGTKIKCYPEHGSIELKF